MRVMTMEAGSPTACCRRSPGRRPTTSAARTRSATSCASGNRSRSRGQGSPIDNFKLTGTGAADGMSTFFRARVTLDSGANPVGFEILEQTGDPFPIAIRCELNDVPGRGRS